MTGSEGPDVERRPETGDAFVDAFLERYFRGRYSEWKAVLTDQAQIPDDPLRVTTW